jgi:hypothetical protein
MTVALSHLSETFKDLHQVADLLGGQRINNAVADESRQLRPATTAHSSYPINPAQT